MTRFFSEGLVKTMACLKQASACFSFVVREVGKSSKHRTTEVKPLAPSTEGNCLSDQFPSVEQPVRAGWFPQQAGSLA